MTADGDLTAVRARYPDLDSDALSILVDALPSLQRQRLLQNERLPDSELWSIVEYGRRELHKRFPTRPRDLWAEEEPEVDARLAAVDEICNAVRKRYVDASHEATRHADQKANAIAIGVWCVGFAVVAPIFFKQDGWFGLVVAGMVAVILPFVALTVLYKAAVAVAFIAWLVALPATLAMWIWHVLTTPRLRRKLPWFLYLGVIVVLLILALSSE
jgi:hypothetical protein